MCVKVLLSKIVAREHMEVVPVDLNVPSEPEVGRSDELAVVVDVLVFASLKEPALDDAGVLHRGLVNRD